MPELRMRNAIIMAALKEQFTDLSITVHRGSLMISLCVLECHVEKHICSTRTLCNK